MRKRTPEITLPQYEGPLTPRMQFEDLLGSLAQTAARIGTRSGKKYEEVDSWQRSHAGKFAAFTTYGEVQTEAAELAIEQPYRTLRMMAAVRGNFIGHFDLNLIEGISFTMSEPAIAEAEGEPQVRMHMHLMGDYHFGRDLTYQDFRDICEATGVYEQTPLPRYKRLANWVMSHLRKNTDDNQEWE